MTKKEDKSSGITKGVLRPIVILVLGLWLVGMGTVTWLEAWTARDQFRAHFEEVQRALPWYAEESLDDLLFDFMDSYGMVDDFYFHPLISDRYHWHDRDLFGASMLLRADPETPGQPGPLLMDDGNYLFFYYGDEGSGGYAFIDMDETAFGRELAAELSDDFWRNDVLFGDISGWTGYFEGARFHLVKVVRDHGEKETVGTAELGQALVTLSPGGVKYHLADRVPVTMEGVTYDSLEDMLLEAPEIVSRDSIWETVLYSRVELGQQEGEDTCYVELVMRYRPLAQAVKCIGTKYLWTLLIAVAVIILFWWQIRRQLGEPVQEMIRRGEKDIVYVAHPAQSRWEEVCQLQGVYDRLRDRIREQKKEKEQLSAALDHAGETELWRRKMVAQISRELKTPLAVIHSYAKGLDGAVDPEKQSRYLGSILEETEDMDALVLEMLDYSRLEAGRVKLQSDRFSLAQVTRQVLGDLAPMAADRKVDLVPQTVEDLQIVADGARIAQAIRNLVSHAIRQARPEGEVRVNVYHYEDRTHFTVESQCDPLPQQTLEMLWDSYDPTETSKGSGGLELPIARAIIGLHGGTCTAEATSQGVKFRFTLD